MSGKAVIPLVAGLCIGGLALKIGIDKIRSAEGSPGNTVQVWTPRTHIPVGTIITAEMIKPIDFPEKLVPEGAVRKQEDIVGRVPQVGAPAGLPVLASMLLPPGELPGLHVPRGFRGVAVKVDEGSGVSNHLLPGAWVDVIGYFQITDRNKRITVARTIIENVEVGAVGSVISADRTDSDGDGGKSKPARSVTLFVKPDMVPTLHLAEQRGRIKLSMRNNNDEATNLTNRNITDDEVVTGERADPEVAAGDPQPPTDPQPPVQTNSGVGPVAVTPADPEPEPWVVVIWNGNKKERFAFLSADSMKEAPGSGDRPSRPRSRNTVIIPGPQSLDPTTDPAGVPEPIEQKPEDEPEPEELE